GAGGFSEGDPVLVFAMWGCGSCRFCVSGAENLCSHRPERPGGGLGRDGGLAEYLLVPAPRLLVGIDGLDPAGAAPLADAALTPYHALRQRLPLRPGASVVVIGAGGLGHIAVQLLRALTPARVVAVDLRESARELALAAGAHAAIDGNGLDAAGVREETGPGGGGAVNAAIAGLGITEMGKIYGRTAADFAAEAVALALDDAGLQKSDVDGLLINGNGNEHMTPYLQMALGFQDLSMLNVMSAAGSTVGAMVQYAALALEAGVVSNVGLLYADAPLQQNVGAAAAD